MVNTDKNLGGVRNSAVASQPCPSGHITADKRLRYAQIAFGTSFIRKTLSEMPEPALGRYLEEIICQIEIKL